MSEKRYVIGITPYTEEGRQFVPVRYQNGIKASGGEYRMIPVGTPIEALADIVDALDAMLFPGGDDVDPATYGAQREPECGASIPEQDKMEAVRLKLCLDRKKPILGICRGCQIINACLGGTLIQDVPKRFGAVHQMAKSSPSGMAHDVRIVRGTMLDEIMDGDIRVNSYHHQCVDRLADGLIPTAYSPEGFIEAYEMPRGEQFLMAVQWHPEITLPDDIYSVKIFERFRDAIIETEARHS